MRRLIFSILVSVVNIFWLAGCSQRAIVTPEWSGIKPPPIEVTLTQLSAEYLIDKNAADTKYKGKTLFLPEVRVEEVIGGFFSPRNEGFGNINYFKEYFISGSIKFEVEDFYILQNIEPNYVLKIVGECQGMGSSMVTITSCWVGSVIGDIGASMKGSGY